MAQQINDNFQLLAGLPIDDRTKKPTISERDSIPSTRRFQGLLCFVEQTQTLYQLQGGITNSNWIGIAGQEATSGLETVIEGFYVISAGKDTPLDWEIGDKFRGWISNRYVVGEILSLPVSLPSDIDDPAKVNLVVDSASEASNYTNTVYVNNNDPNLATIFDLNNPPTVNDPLLEEDVNNLYIGLDASPWVYSTVSGTYETKTITSNTSNFYFEGTEIDAEGSKTAPIERSGNVAIFGNIGVGKTPSVALDIVGPITNNDDIHLNAQDKPIKIGTQTATNFAQFYYDSATKSLIFTNSIGQTTLIIKDSDRSVTIPFLARAGMPTELMFACSDETTDLTVGTLLTFRMPIGVTLTGVKLSVNVASAFTKVIVDIKKNGTTIFSTLASIDVGATTSVGASVPYVISNNNLSDDSVIAISTTSVGSGTLAKGLKVTLLGIKQ